MKSGSQNIVLTGASGGLGQALVRALAAPNVVFLLLGRDRVRLQEAAEEAVARGASAIIASIPLQDSASLTKAIYDFDHNHPIDLVIANAGVKSGNKKGVEPIDQVQRVIDVNLTGTVMTVQACLPSMLARGTGHIAIMSSISAISPQADLLTYSATKAALRSYAVALRRSLRGSEVRVTTIIPGFVETDMTARHKGRTPFLVGAENAAKIIARGLNKKKATIEFPKTLAILARLGELLPVPLSDLVNVPLRAEIEPDDDERRKN